MSDLLPDGRHTVQEQVYFATPVFGPVGCTEDPACGTQLGVDAVNGASTNPILAEVKFVPALLIPGILVGVFMIGRFSGRRPRQTTRGRRPSRAVSDVGREGLVDERDAT